MINEQIREILELMAQNEDKINQLYALYAGKFSDHVDFWTNIAKEETNHALWIRNLSKLSHEEDIRFNDMFSREAVETYSRVVDAKIMKANSDEVTLHEALQNAYDLETGLIESNCFKMFQVESEQFQRVLEKLVDDTEKHQFQVKQELDKHPE